MVNLGVWVLVALCAVVIAVHNNNAKLIEKNKQLQSQLDESEQQEPQLVRLEIPPLLEEFILRHAEEYNEHEQESGSTRNNPTPSEPARPVESNSDTQPQDPPLPVEDLRFTQTTVPSQSQKFPFATELVIQTNVEIQSPALIIKCEEVFGEMEIRSEPVLMNYLKGTVTDHPSWGYLSFGYPTLKPSKPLIVLIMSSAPNKVVNVTRLPSQVQQ
jgi:hypothetical protein